MIAVAEFYQAADPLFADIASSQQRTWMVIGIVTLCTYLLLAGFVRGASNTILRQQAELRDKLDQNEELHERVRRASRRVTTLNERSLRRISAELHDGPAQDLGIALLHLDRIAAFHETSPLGEVDQDIMIVQRSLQQAMSEVRAISAGLSVPDLHTLSLAETAQRAVRAHERRTSTQVKLTLGELPHNASSAVKIALYRFIQEGLSNAFRHAGSVGQQVEIYAHAGELVIEVSDRGPGFQPPVDAEWGLHLGLAGMRERIETLGGRFSITSQPGQGTLASARMPLYETVEEAE